MENVDRLAMFILEVFQIIGVLSISYCLFSACVAVKIKAQKVIAAIKKVIFVKRGVVVQNSYSSMH
ncbi:hypothetical protein [Vibrio alginolyticus]|uniref:hypothetical protein n=1 Tax=Vibrio alginolyticus TaxID=663 RepID=UPI0022AA3D49|nr:hypothetical protein [Vibrio alginolyticus]MCZ2798990.1 hypothetical protein [Vibrio alginolyticus]